MPSDPLRSHPQPPTAPARPLAPEGSDGLTRDAERRARYHRVIASMTFALKPRVLERVISGYMAVADAEQADLKIIQTKALDTIVRLTVERDTARENLARLAADMEGGESPHLAAKWWHERQALRVQLLGAKNLEHDLCASLGRAHATIAANDDRIKQLVAECWKHAEALPIPPQPVEHTCGGCQGLGSHKRWCAAVVGDLASHLGTYSEDAEHLADMVGANCAGAANALYRAAGLLDAAATEAAR